MSVIVENADWKLVKNADGTLALVDIADKITIETSKKKLLGLQSILDGAVQYA